MDIKKTKTEISDLETCFPKGIEMESQDLHNEFMSSLGASFLQGGAFSVVILYQSPHPVRKKEKQNINESICSVSTR